MYMYMYMYFDAVYTYSDNVHATDHNGALFAMRLVQVQHFLEGVVADDVAVQDKERFRVTLQYLSSQAQRTRWGGV